MAEEFLVEEDSKMEERKRGVRVVRSFSSPLFLEKEGREKKGTLVQ